jgi:glutaconate CoA-transferase subunit A
LAADRRGNAILNGNLGVDRELAMIADTVIITAEQIVDKIEDYGPSVDIVGMVTTAVVHAPRGAYPTSCYPLYPVAGGEVMRYIDTCNDAGFSTYLEYITSTQWPAN